MGKQDEYTTGYVHSSEKFGMLQSMTLTGDHKKYSSAFFLRSAPVPDYDWRATVEPERES